MITALLSLFCILLLIISGFFFKKAAAAFSIVIPENKHVAFKKFCSFNGWIYLVFALITFGGVILNADIVTVATLIIVSLYTASVAWQIASFVKK